eukprot:89757-Prymnesium_polylepis.1
MAVSDSSSGLVGSPSNVLSDRDASAVSSHSLPHSRSARVPPRVAGAARLGLAAHSPLVYREGS